MDPVLVGVDLRPAVAWRCRSLVRRLDPQLPRPVWLLQIGGVLNSLGNGIVLPFLVIYLHDVRGFGLGTAGLVVAVVAAAQLTAGVFAGPRSTGSARASRWARASCCRASASG